MIDFRYHLVSIIAVFLALGLGIVLGATTIEPSVLSALKKTSGQEETKIGQLYAAQSQLQGELARDQQFAAAAEPQLLRGLLTGERVVVVEAPGAPSTVVAGVAAALADAGAAVSGQVELQNKFFDGSSSTQSALATLAAQLTPAGVALGPGTPLQQASRVLAGAILTRDGPGQPVAGQQDAAASAVLNGFGAEGFLTQTGNPAVRANLAVVVIPAAPSSTNESNPASQALVTMAQGLDGVGQGVVVAGSAAGSGPGSAIDVMRSGGRSGHMTSVDNADSVIGQIVVAQALTEQLRGGNGSYGSAATANAAGPSPAPTPSPSQSATPSAVGAKASRRSKA